MRRRDDILSPLMPLAVSTSSACLWFVSPHRHRQHGRHTKQNGRRCIMHVLAAVVTLSWSRRSPPLMFAGSAEVTPRTTAASTPSGVCLCNTHSSEEVSRADSGTLAPPSAPQSCSTARVQSPAQCFTNVKFYIYNNNSMTVIKSYRWDYYLYCFVYC